MKISEKKGNKVSIVIELHATFQGLILRQPRREREYLIADKVATLTAFLAIAIVLTTRFIFDFHLRTLSLLFFLYSQSSFKRRQIAKISTCNRNQKMFTPLKFKDQDVLPHKTLRESFIVTCCN